MAEILDKVLVSQELRAAIQVIAQREGRRITDIEADMTSLIQMPTRTLNSWTALSSIPNTIETRALLGIIWLAVTRGHKDLDWLLLLLRATDIVMVDDPTPKTVRAIFRLARLEGEPPSEAHIDRVLEQLFNGESLEGNRASIRTGSRRAVTIFAIVVLLLGAVGFLLSQKPSRVCSEPVKRTNPQFLPDQGFSLYQTATNGSGLLSNQVRTIRFNEQGLWVGYIPGNNDIDGVSYYDRITEQWTHCRGLQLSNNQVVNDFAFTEDAVFLSTDGAGIAVLEGAMWKTYTKDHGLPNNSVYGLSIDGSGSVWAATLLGVAKLEGERWEVVYQGNPGELSGNHVVQMFDDEYGNRWFALLDRGISRLTPERQWQSYFTDDPGLQNVRGIASDFEGGVWFATSGGGVLRFFNDEWAVITATENGLPSDNIRDIERDKFGRIWVATTEGVAYTSDLGATWDIHSTLDIMDVEFGCAGCTVFDDVHLALAVTGQGVGHVRIPPETPTIRVVSAPEPVQLQPNEIYTFEIIVEVLEEGFHTADGDSLRSIEPIGVDLHGAYDVIEVLEDVEIGQTYVFNNVDTPIKEDTPGRYQLRWRVWQGRRFVSEPIIIEFEVVDG